MHRLFIDEVGNSDLHSANSENERYLSLTGVIVELSYHDRHFSSELDALKLSIFGTDEAPLHRRELRRREPPFEVLRDPAVRQQFDSGILQLFANLEYRVITVVIDKKDHSARYRVWRHHPYHYCLTVMLERYVMHLTDIGSMGDVMVESRQRVDNEKLSAAYRHFYRNGSDWIDGDRARRLLTTGELKLKGKSANIAGLQFADLLAHPSFRWIHCQRHRTTMTATFGLQVVNILRAGKYLCSPRGTLKGWGCKWLP